MAQGKKKPIKRAVYKPGKTAKKTPKTTQVVKFVKRPGIVAKRQEQLSQLALQSRAFHLAAKGHTYDHIADKLGIDTKLAFDLVKSKIASLQENFKLAVDQVRRREEEKLDALESILWNDAEGRMVQNEDGTVTYIPPDKIAIRLIMDIIDKRRAIHGLDAPKNVKIEDKEGIRREYVGTNLDNL